MSPLPAESILVSKLASLFATRRRDVLLGLGDDAAVVRGGDHLVFTTDSLVEGHDFQPGWSAFHLGRKALSVNLSDLAAMGAEPLYALLTLALPRDTATEWLDSFLHGFKAAATEYDTAVIGGDLSAAPSIFVSVTAVGRTNKKGLLKRSEASPSESIYVSGTLGAAAAGLELLRRGYRLGDSGEARDPGGKRIRGTKSESVERLMTHQLNPRPMISLGRILADRSLASSAMDVSDGLVRDLHRLCKASGTGAVIEEQALPIDSRLEEISSLIHIDPLETALYGAEDFGLLFTVAKAKEKLLSRLASRFSLRRIGVMDRSGTVTLASPDRTRVLSDRGFDHFAQGTSSNESHLDGPGSQSSNLT